VDQGAERLQEGGVWFPPLPAKGGEQGGRGEKERKREEKKHTRGDRAVQIEPMGAKEAGFRKGEARDANARER
jgi:hypothetical protein